MASRELIKTDKNGTKYWNTRVKCWRCVSGTYMWGSIYSNSNGHITGASHSGTCWRCGGSGYVWEIVKEYTPEYRAKLDARNEKRKEKLAAEREASRKAREAEIAAREAERKAREEEWARKRKGHFYGKVGDKIEIELTYKGNFEFKTNFGSMSIYRFDTDDGAHLVWKSSALLGGMEWMINEDDRITIRATIKDHKDYKGIDQTELTRVKVLKAMLKWSEEKREYEPYNG